MARTEQNSEESLYQQGVPNWQNRTLFHGDNLKFLRAMNSESVHLIATDPPFNKKRDFHTTSDNLVSGASFQDRWSWDDDVHGQWVAQIAEDFPKVENVVQGRKNSYGDDMGAFLCFMAVRLVEMKRILREDGSIYLHCDPTASHYLKMLMDAIFGRKNFRNEIIWCYPPKGNPPKFGFHRKHDTLLFYGKSENIGIFNHQYTSLDDYQISKFSNTDEHGRKYKEFKGRRTYLDESRGRPVPTCWDDIGQTGQSRTEFIGYPTQKPLKLYERIIKASSNQGDIVLDPFAGSATTCIAAEKLDRQWVGIDIWDQALDVVLCRLEKEGLKVLKHIRQKKVLKELLLAESIHFTSELPERNDDGEKAVPFLKPKIVVSEPKDGFSSNAATRQGASTCLNSTGWFAKAVTGSLTMTDTWNWTINYRSLMGAGIIY